jgi:molybdenum ABC transporter molybdate-binding protein
MSGGTARRGSANPLIVLVVGGLIAVAILVGLLIWISRPQGEEARQLVLLCAAGMRVPVEEITAQYEKEHGVRIKIEFGGSNTLLSRLQISKGKSGDLYLAADDWYTGLAREKGLVAETMPVARMMPVMAVATGNPKGIQTVADLAREDVRVALANPEQAAIGKAIKNILTSLRAGDGTLWDKIEAHVTSGGVFKPTVSEVANDVKIGSVDVGVVWDPIVRMPKYRDFLESIEAPEFAQEQNLVTLGVVSSSAHPTSALRFARYLTARDKGLPAFDAYGFRPVIGDVWAWQPELTFFCGAVNRRAVDEVIKAFEQREGVKVNTIYNGCGILTGQMKTIRRDQGGEGFPDVYMACDRYYLENVKEWFQEDVDVSDADIVIAVPKGNPKGIQGLDDLTREGMRISVGQPEQCTIGALTRTLLDQEGLRDAVMENVVMQTASSAMLVPTVATGSVDASIAYITDTIAARDEVDTVRIDSPHAQAVKPFSIAKSSDHKYLGRRLFQAIADAQEQFEAAGFHFRIGDHPATAESEPK